MRFVHFLHEGHPHLGVKTPEGVRLIGPYRLEELLRMGVDLSTYGKNVDGPLVEVGDDAWLPPLTRPGKIICVGLNYLEHTKESHFEQPVYPTLFQRFSTSLIGHNRPIVRPKGTDSLDYECEMAVILQKGGRHIPQSRALDCVAGYAPFNDASVREYQFKTPQWTMGKNFDDTGAFGPELVTADELPEGGKGLSIETRVNGRLLQSSNTRDMVFDVATLIELISVAITLEPGDIIVSGTPSGVGVAREPKLFMHGGDTVEVAIEGFDVLRNPIVDEQENTFSRGKLPY